MLFPDSLKEILVKFLRDIARTPYNSIQRTHVLENKRLNLTNPLYYLVSHVELLGSPLFRAYTELKRMYISFFLNNIISNELEDDENHNQFRLFSIKKMLNFFCIFHFSITCLEQLIYSTECVVLQISEKRNDIRSSIEGNNTIFIFQMKMFKELLRVISVTVGTESCLSIVKTKLVPICLQSTSIDEPRRAAYGVTSFIKMMGVSYVAL